MLIGLGFAGLIVWVTAGLFIARVPFGTAERGSGGRPDIARAARKALLYIVVIGLAVIAALALAYLLGRLFGLSSIVQREHTVHEWIQRHRTQPTTRILSRVTTIGTTWPDFWTGIGIGIVIAAAQRRLRPLLLLVPAIPISFYAQKWCKTVVHLPKPDQATVVGPVGSYPSGGVIRVTLLVGLSVVLIAPYVASTARRALVIVAVVVNYLEVFSRVYLGRHWLSDIIAGLLLGLIPVVVVGVLERRVSGVPTRTRRTPVPEVTMA